MPVTLMGYILAGGCSPMMAIAWLLFGLLWHYAGFLQNNLFDYKYDKLDPAKQHFPLVKGTIRYRDAAMVDTIMLILLFIFGVLLTLSPYSIAFLILGMVSGTIYNYYSKRTLLKPIPIALCFSSLPAMSYTSIKPPDTLMWLIFSAVFTTIFYQIAFSGELKDIHRGERNILLRLPQKHGVAAFAIASKTINMVIIHAILIYLAKELTILSAIILAALETVTAEIAILLMAQLDDYQQAITKTWDRDKALKNMSMMEVATYIATVIAVSPVLGYTTPLWIILPILWFIAFNRIIFGTTSYPKV